MGYSGYYSVHSTKQCHSFLIDLLFDSTHIFPAWDFFWQSFEFSMATPLIPEYETKTLAKYRLYIGAGDNPFYYTDTLLPLPIRLKHVERSDFAKKAWENTISTLCFVGGSLKKKYTQKIKWNVLIAHNLRLSSLHDIAVVCQNHPGCNPFIDIGLNV